MKNNSSRIRIKTMNIKNQIYKEVKTKFRHKMLYN